MPAALPLPLGAPCPSYKAHPLFLFRRRLLINVAIGMPILIIATFSHTSYILGTWMYALFMLLLSGLLALADLCIWLQRRQEQEHEKANERQGRRCRICARQITDGREDADALVRSYRPVLVSPMMLDGNDNENGGGDQQSMWPIRWIRVVDFLLSGALLWTVLVVLNVESSTSFYEDPFSIGRMAKYYSTVPIGYSAIIHARCWWRQYRAKEMQKWVMTLSLGRGWTRTVGDIESCEPVAVHGACQKVAVTSRDMSRLTGDGEASACRDKQRRTDSVQATVQALDREVRKALPSQNRLSTVSDSQERQPLLSDHGFDGRRVRPIDDGTERCICSPFASCHTRPFESDRTCKGRFIDSIDNESGDNASPDTATRSGEAATDSSDTRLTPSGTDSGIHSSSTTDSCGSSEGRIIDDRNTRAKIGDAKIANDINLAPHNHKVTPIVVSGEADENIMVVRKVKKWKTKARNGKKGDTGVGQ